MDISVHEGQTQAKVLVISNLNEFPINVRGF